MNVVRWGGGGIDGKGVLYTASSDRTVRIWDANGVSGKFHITLKPVTDPEVFYREGFYIR